MSDLAQDLSHDLAHDLSQDLSGGGTPPVSNLMVNDSGVQLTDDPGTDMTSG